MDEHTWRFRTWPLLVALAPTLSCSTVWDFHDATLAADDAGAPDASRDGAIVPTTSQAGDASIATPTSCVGATANCGPAEDVDCCTSLSVPGGTFRRSFDGVTYTDPTYPATVRAFRLDRYEVTVGRFRAFVAGYPTNRPSPGMGANAHVVSDDAWDPSWSARMPPTQGALISALKTCNAGYITWTDTPGQNELKPMDCISWYEAFAFCVWDGGRLPTEAEWNYAAAGGSEQRVYPWSKPANGSTIDTTFAVFNASASGLAKVGSRSSRGDGRWGHADLAGNVDEWTRDGYVSPYPLPCDDCATLDEAGGRVLRGGSFTYDAPVLLVSNRVRSLPAAERNDGIGARCARDQ